MLRPLVHLITRHVLINILYATFLDQLNAWDDFNRVEHDALVVPAARAKFLVRLLFVRQCLPRVEITR